MKKIGLLGPYGYGNLGDAAIQEAMIQHIHCYHQAAQIYGFSLNPEDTEKRHGIPSYPITRGFEMSDNWLSKLPGPIRNHLSGKRLVRFFAKIPTEIILTVGSLKALEGFDLLIVSGGGQLDDYWGGAWWHPYTLLKWALMARLRRTKLIFASVGAGPLDAALSRFFIRKALSLASYRSYRDESSKRFVQRIGFPANGDPVYPDLAYSLPLPACLDFHDRAHTRPVAAVGPMSYFDPRVWPERDEAVYLGYLRKLASFVAWLIQHNYTILLIAGESIHDRWAIDDLKTILKEEEGISRDRQILDPPIESVDDLTGQLSTADIVVASRLHNVILSHVLHKPVLAISYHEKIDVLMADLGQSEYCLPIDTFDVATLIEKFTALESRLEVVRQQIMKRTAAYRGALEEQYEIIFNGQ